MLNEKSYILSTRPLDLSLIIEAANNNIKIDLVSFIKTEPILNSFLKKRISESFYYSSTVIFTSMNAVESVAGYLEDNDPKWNIYCLGTATNNIVRQYFPLSEICGVAENASSLADEIIKNKKDHVIFFCGDQRRDELPVKLTSKNITVEEIAVYNTIATPVKIEKKYNGILFFSPSAVESFFSVNTVFEDTILFAIGSTTSDCIRLYSNNRIIQSDLPGKNNLAEKAINYFDKSSHTNEHIKK